MGKDSKMFDGPIKEEKLDPVYQGGYSDGYDAGEQYGYVSGWNDAIEEAEKLIKASPTKHYLASHFAAVISEIKK